MAITNPTSTQHTVLQRFRTPDGYTGHRIAAPSLGLRMFGAVLGRFPLAIVLQRFRATDGHTGCGIIAPSLGLRMFGAVLGCFPLAIGLDHGRIVSISRGSPPPKKR